MKSARVIDFDAILRRAEARIAYSRKMEWDSVLLWWWSLKRELSGPFRAVPSLWRCVKAYRRYQKLFGWRAPHV